jgi:hypothetical protein
MYFWRVDQLVKDLRAGIVPEYDKMKYLLFGLLLAYFFTNMAGPATRIPGINAVLSLLECFILIWGVYHCFAINREHDNKNFLERFICLSFPLVLQLAVCMAVVISVIVIIYAFGAAGTLNVAGVNDQIRNSMLPVVVQFCALIMTVIYYIVLGKKIAATASH